MPPADEYRHADAGVRLMDAARHSADTTGGTRLRALRLARPLTIRALADASGCSCAAISSYEIGARRPSRHAVLALAAALGLVVADANALLLAFDEWPIGTLVEQVQAMLAADPRLTPRGQATVLNVLITELASIGHGATHESYV